MPGGRTAIVENGKQKENKIRHPRSGRVPEKGIYRLGMGVL